MNLIVISVYYPPNNSSTAVQISNLVNELASQGHFINVITQDNSLTKSYVFEESHNIRVSRFKSGNVNHNNLFMRALNEFLMPIKIIFAILKNRLNFRLNQGIIWWSPSIFFTPLVIYLKIINRCKCYLILRDIFPRWAKDLKIIKSNFIYFILKIFFLLQCFFSDIIGVQSKNNKKFIPKSILFRKINTEVLNNWYTPNIENQKLEIDFSQPNLNKRKIFIHAGNIGLAQGFKIFIEVAEILKDKNEIGFLFIGRGTQFEEMKKLTRKKSLTNILFLDQIPNSKIISLYKKCFCGIVSLDQMHKTHNIPGKFISYLHGGLNVFALVNSGNDLIDFVNKNRIGLATDNYDPIYISEIIYKLSQEKLYLEKHRKKSKMIADKFFNTKKIANQIISNF